ncbi:phosphoribosylglycinamide formyltransferase, formyltetrahydrofolate-dependent [Halobacteroides halobius DSM 5150]|uniref:Phosphoribosylglycinamide formyltransferase n=1 Tax=Halobacteroides halobius (strain ATCC 35273 / DSM 5150 / MD-1) TaxID=748449 RepID=L0KAY3_HALHC|nr:phosphoribosylglycinamide formyltransferase [Halobacteroides halobius]AGB42457.1 phosphoribosylglycinamide formyltransferase, formyltetrahydrofolate-dependent [Halobacteroides halobius DSM 5150]
MLKIGVLASGRGTNLQSIIDGIKAGEIPAEIEVVISDKETAKALERAAKYDIDNQYVNPQDYNTTEEFEQGMIDILEQHNVQLVIMAGFMRLLTPYFVKKYKDSVMNIHPSLLPAFKGLHAQKQALDYGVKVAGCTVHFADEGMDTGPIILQATVPVKEDDTEETLANRILQKEHKIYPKAIRLYAEDKLEVKNGKVIIKE